MLSGPDLLLCVKAERTQCGSFFRSVFYDRQTQQFLCVGSDGPIQMYRQVYRQVYRQKGTHRPNNLESLEYQC